MLRPPLALLAWLLLPLGVARAGDAWDALVQKVDRADPEAVQATRRGLEAQHPDFWRQPQRRGGLLAALALDLAPAEIEREWQRAEQRYAERIDLAAAHPQPVAEAPANRPRRATART